MNRLTNEYSILETIDKIQNDITFLKEVALRFAAYEDTGLEPEQVKQLNDAFKNSQKKLEKAFDDLLAYKDLEEQGLLIKLPCKVDEKTKEQILFLCSNDGNLK
jgi:hypothetical protein